MEKKRRRVRVFISYAKKNQKGAEDFIERFRDYCAPSKRHEYVFWQFAELAPGSVWDEEIRRRLEACDCGLLLISPSFLSSRYIAEVELPALLQSGKPLIPVALAPFDLEKHDLLGLETRQIFYYPESARFYTQLSQKKKERFVAELFARMEERLADPLP